MNPLCLGKIHPQKCLILKLPTLNCSCSVHSAIARGTQTCSSRVHESFNNKRLHQRSTRADWDVGCVKGYEDGLLVFWCDIFQW